MTSTLPYPALPCPTPPHPHSHISGLSHPHSPVVAEQPPADDAAGDTAHSQGSCTLGVLHVLEGADIGSTTADLLGWKPAIINTHFVASKLF